MLVNSHSNPVVQHTQRTDLDPTTAAASALYSGLVQNPMAAGQAASTIQATNNTVSDNVDSAFAKTRVLLQATEPATAAPKSGTSTSATDEFKEYMNKPVAQQMRDQILKELGITEGDLQSMTPGKREALEHQIADRIKDKANVQQAEKQQEKGDNNAVAETFLASN